jgi:phage regulator Rha-like protein
MTEKDLKDLKTLQKQADEAKKLEREVKMLDSQQTADLFGKQFDKLLNGIDRMLTLLQR